METYVAVTGASGHIGNVLIPLLINKGYRVRALVYKQRLACKYDSLEIVNGSLDDRRSLDKLVKGCQLVIHCAAHISIKSRKDPSVYGINYSGTRNVFEASLHAGVKRFIHLSSIHAFDQLIKDLVLNESTGHCADNAPLYDVSKRDAEKYILEHAKGKMDVVVLNPTSVVGPYDTKPSLMGKALMDIYKRKVPMLIKGGFDFCDVRAVATGIISAMDKGRNGEKYLLSGKWHSLEEIQDYIVNLREDKRKLMILPSRVAWIGLPFIKLWALLINRDPLYTRESIIALVDGHRNISSKKAVEELGYSSRPFAETVADTLNWFKENGYLK
jgi:dihydroflavonol-4-reductase